MNLKLKEKNDRKNTFPHLPKEINRLITNNIQIEKIVFRARLSTNKKRKLSKIPL
jgi:hypothetical protein